MSDLSILINSCLSTGITERTPTVRNVTSRVSCAQDQGLSPAGPVPLLFLSYKAPSCVLSIAHTASINLIKSANSATSAVRLVQVQIKDLLQESISQSCFFFFGQVFAKYSPMVYTCLYVNIRHRDWNFELSECVQICLQMPRLKVV